MAPILWRNPLPHFLEAVEDRQWWKLALALAAFISAPTYEFVQLRTPRPGMPPVTNGAPYYIALAGLAAAGLVIVALLLASLLRTLRMRRKTRGMSILDR